MNQNENYMQLQFAARSENEAFARVCAAAFAARLDCTVEDISDIKTAISEAVTNAVIHAYGKAGGEVTLRGEILENTVRFEVRDTGRGIADIDRAMQPFYSTGNPEERTGMGFTVMQSFMDAVEVSSAPDQGTTVVLVKHMLPHPAAAAAAKQ